ncbi:MAG: DoxX family protein [Candidatus Taylorbacteria bacterium]|nr:DoxX family protein [Candidatus Taylorbacteria bacterium]
MNPYTDRLTKYAPIVVRIGVSLVFLWFGLSQLSNTAMWVQMIPDWVISLSGLSATTIVHFNGSFEIVFGLALLVGLCTRVTAFFLALHMLHITLTVGYTAVGVRDFGLTLAAFSVFFHGLDTGTFDYWMKKKQNIS